MSTNPISRGTLDSYFDSYAEPSKFSSDSDSDNDSDNDSDTGSNSNSNSNSKTEQYKESKELLLKQGGNDISNHSRLQIVRRVCLRILLDSVQETSMFFNEHMAPKDMLVIDLESESYIERARVIEWKS